jgi:hypothetical protein
VSDLATTAAAAFSGGAFGLAGTLFGRAAGLAERVLGDRQERARWSHDLQMRALDRELASDSAAAAERLADLTGAWRGLEASQTAEAAIQPSYPWVQAIRALVRPTLTLALWVIAAGAAGFAASNVSLADFAETAGFAAVAATLWWFGDRAPNRSTFRRGAPAN